jgi:hypothetical protein
MKKFKSKGKKRRRVLLGTGRCKISLNMVQIKMRDGREVSPIEIDGIAPIDRDQNLVLEWWE